MPAFSNGKKESEPGRPIVRHEVVKETHTEHQNIDVGALAQAVAEALGKMPGSTVYRSDNGDEIEDNFDNAKSLDKLADSMTVQRGNSEANFDDLGGVEETKKDVKEVNKTIDLLRGLDN